MERQWRLAGEELAAWEKEHRPFVEQQRAAMHKIQNYAARLLVQHETDENLSLRQIVNEDETIVLYRRVFSKGQPTLGQLALRTQSHTFPGEFTAYRVGEYPKGANPHYRGHPPLPKLLGFKFEMAEGTWEGSNPFYTPIPASDLQTAIEMYFDEELGLNR